MSPAIGFKRPCPGCYGDGRSGTATAWNVIDEYKVPADLAKGDYLISWRWDCEVNTQMYIQCLDAKVGSGPAPGPAPAPPAQVYGCVNSQCVASTSGVPKETCLAVCHTAEVGSPRDNTVCAKDLCTADCILTDRVLDFPQTTNATHGMHSVVSGTLSKPVIDPTYT
eukprot:gene2132-15220_t